MQKLFEPLTQAFRENHGILSHSRYACIVKQHSTLFEESDTVFLLLQASGYPISETDNGYRLDTYFIPYEEQKFCIIDIETNGSKPGSSQIIEIGAVMVQNREIIDRYESFVACAYLPEYITRITGIHPEDLKEAPSRKEALIGLRRFMQDAVFVAHNANFDYTFLNASFARFGLGSIGNPKLCTIDLAQRTFESERYGLGYLIESLGLETATHHRALSDALCAAAVMQKSMQTLPEYIRTTDDLLRFSLSSKKERRFNKE